MSEMSPVHWLVAQTQACDLVSKFHERTCVSAEQCLDDCYATMRSLLRFRSPELPTEDANGQNGNVIGANDKIRVGDVAVVARNDDAQSR